MVDTALLKCYTHDKFRDIVPIEYVLKRALDTLYCMFSFKSGITKEHSIEYQLYNFLCLKRLYDVIAENNILESNITTQSLHEFYDKVKQATKKILSMSLRMDHTYFPIGDSKTNACERQLSLLFDCAPPTALTNVALYRGQECFALFEEGFCFFRGNGAASHKFKFISRLNKPLEHSSNIDLVFLCGWHSNNHKSNDELSFILDYKGVNFFDDAGYNEFIAWDEVLKLQDENHHNTITVKSLAWSDRRNPDGKNLIYGYFDNNYCYMEGEHFRINGHRVARKIYIRNDNIFIADYVDPLINEISRHRFILGSGVKVRGTHFADGKHIKVTLLKNNIVMEMHCTGKHLKDMQIGTINVIAGKDRKFEKRLTLDFFADSPDEQRISFFITFTTAFSSKLQKFIHACCKSLYTALCAASKS